MSHDHNTPAAQLTPLEKLTLALSDARMAYVDEQPNRADDALVLTELGRVIRLFENHGRFATSILAGVVPGKQRLARLGPDDDGSLLYAIDHLRNLTNKLTERAS